MNDQSSGDGLTRRQNPWLNVVITDPAGADGQGGSAGPGGSLRQRGVVTGQWMTTAQDSGTVSSCEASTSGISGPFPNPNLGSTGGSQIFASSFNHAPHLGLLPQFHTAPMNLSHLSAIDDQVGKGLDNIFISTENRPGSARTAKHISSGPLQSHLPTSMTKHNFAHFTPQNMLKSERQKEWTSRTANKRHKLNPQTDSEKNKNIEFTVVKDGQKRQWVFPTEIWFRILELSGLRTMMDAQRVHPSLRAHLVEKQALWRNCRLVEFGKDAPEPPLGISEKEFAGLIVGYGCQKPNCPHSKSLKVYWAFRRRWCRWCYTNETLQFNHLEAFQTQQKRALLDLIPSAIFTSGKYRYCRKVKETSDEWMEVNENKLTFSRRDVASIENEYESLLGSGKTADQAVVELQNLHAFQLLTNFRNLDKIEKWEKKVKHSVRHREARRAMFESEALKLKDPISNASLSHMLPFHKALDSNRAPTFEQFEQLRPKLIPLKEEADRIIKVDAITASYHWAIADEAHLQPEIKAYMELHRHRHQRNSEGEVIKNQEQKAVLNFMSDILDDVLRDDPADSDLVLMVLFQVKAYWSSHMIHGKLFNGVAGPYQLSMDDAKMIVEALQQDPRVKDSGRDMTVIFRRFRCPACPRNDKEKRYEFDELFEHLDRKHSCFASDFSRAMRKPFARPVGHHFPWYTVPWPENLPVLANHQPANSITNALVWNFNQRRDYIRAKPISDISAFVGRSVVPPEPDPQDFVSYVLHAGEIMAPTNLKADVQTAIALRYAIDCLGLLGADRVANMDDLAAASRSITTSQGTQIDHKLQFRFACGICLASTNVSRSSRFVKGVRPIVELIQHWRGAHKLVDASISPALTDLVALKSDEELRDILNQEDTKLRAEKRKTAAEQQKRRKDVRKRPSEKAGVLLRKPFAWETFGRLWELLHEGAQEDEEAIAGCNDSADHHGLDDTGDDDDDDDDENDMEADNENSIFFPDTHSSTLED